MKELDTVALTHDIKEYGLKEGDVGAIVHVHGKKAFEVEFVTATGKTVALVTLESKDVRDVAQNDLLSVRGFSSTPYSQANNSNF